MAFASGILFENGYPEQGLLWVPVGVVAAFVGWFILAWATPLENLLRHRGRQLRLIGASTCTLSAGVYTAAVFLIFFEVDTPEVLLLPAQAILLAFPVGLVLWVGGCVISLWGRHQEFVNRVA